MSGGTILGRVGATGHATGPHVHFEVRRFEVPIDPMPYLLAGTAARIAIPAAAGGHSSAGPAPACRTTPRRAEAQAHRPGPARRLLRRRYFSCRAARHRAQVEGLVERGLVHALLERHLSDGAP